MSTDPQPRGCQVETEPPAPSVGPIAGIAIQHRRDRERTPTRGGHECEFIHPPPNFQTECAICLLVLRSPNLASCCGHNFCKECIERVQKAGKCCPLCNKDNFTLMYNRAHDVSLQQFEVYCTHRKMGCEWTGKLEMLDTHLNVNPKLDKQLQGCAFVEVQCFNDGCGLYYQRRSIVEHQCRACTQRVFSCEHCHEYESTYHDVTTNHWPVCKCYPLPCPHECRQETIQRQNLEQHLKEECPLQEVECEFKYAGCEAKLPRKDVPDHLRDNSIQHMTLLARQNQELMTKLQEKDAKFQQMMEENRRVRSTVDDNRREMEETIACLKEELRARLAERDEQIGEQQSMTRRELGNIILKQELTDSSLKKLEGSTVGVANQLRDVARRQEATDSSFKKLEGSTAGVANQLRDVARRQEATDSSLKKLEGSTAGVANKLRDVARRQEATDSSLKKLEGSTAEVATLKNRLGDVARKQVTVTTTVEKLHHHARIAPVQIVMTNYGQHKQDDDVWFSDGFYADPHGYKVCLNVYANGNGSGEGTHVSCYIYLMRGEFDNHLKWPFRGTVTITLLNQREDKNHHLTKTVNFNDKTPDQSTARLTSGERAGNGWGYHEMIPFSELGYNSATNCQYLLNDCLYFRVKFELC